MTGPQTLDPQYELRAANQAQPDNWVQPNPDDASRGAMLLARVVRTGFQRNTFFNDISEFQPYVNKSYRFPMIATRIDNGWGQDNHWHGNSSVIRGMNSIKLWQNYLVYIPNQERAILSRVKNAFGAKLPDKVTFMIDMESGQGFAGPGNHSAGANWLADELADYANSRKRVSPYANSGDYANCWPNIAPWLRERKNTAAYGGSDPGTYAWQYYGALPYPVPGGYPTSSSPFGSYVDFNVIHRSINQVLVDFGIKKKDWSDMATERQIENLIDTRVAKFTSGDTSDAIRLFAHGGAAGRWHHSSHPRWAHANGQGVLDRLLELEQEVKSLRAQLAATKKP